MKFRVYHQKAMVLMFSCGGVAGLTNLMNDEFSVAARFVSLLALAVSMVCLLIGLYGLWKKYQTVELQEEGVKVHNRLHALEDVKHIEFNEKRRSLHIQGRKWYDSTVLYLWEKKEVEDVRRMLESWAAENGAPLKMK